MAEQNEISHYLHSLLFPNIFKLFRIAAGPGKIMTAFIALLIIFTAGWLMDFTKTVVVAGRVSISDLQTSTLNGSITWPTELHCFVSSPERTEGYISMYKERAGTQKIGVFKVFSNFCIANFNDGVLYLLQLRLDKVSAAVANCILACVWMLRFHTIYGIIFLLISFVVLAMTGGAISRSAAIQFSKGEKPGINYCIQYSLKKFLPMLCAPTAPAILVALLGFVIVSLLGLVTNIPYAGELILAIFFVIVLIAGVLMAFATIWAGASFNLMFGAIAYENSDTFDAVSRAYNYVYARPWRLGLYTFLAALYGGICYLFIRLFAYVMLVMSRWFLQLGIFTQGGKTEQFGKIDAIWSKPEFFNFMGGGMEASRRITESIASTVVYLEILFIAGIVIAFVISFYFSAGTIIYCLLRNKADNTPLDKVFIESETDLKEQNTQTQSEDGA